MSNETNLSQAITESDLLQDICTTKRGINLETLKGIIILAVELAREGREGRKEGVGPVRWRFYHF